MSLCMDTCVHTCMFLIQYFSLLWGGEASQAVLTVLTQLISLPPHPRVGMMGVCHQAQFIYRDFAKCRHASFSLHFE